MAKTPDLDELVAQNEKLQRTIELLALRQQKRSGNPDAKYQVESQAQSHYEGMRANLNPAALMIARLWALRNTEFSFAGVEVNGLKNAKRILTQGGAVVVPTHFSYFDLASTVRVLLGKGENYYIGGDNVVKKGLVTWVFTNVGLVRINRDISMVGKEDALQARVLLAYVERLLRNGKNITIFSGTGRYKDGLLQPYSTILNRVFIPEATAIIPVGTTYTVVPEDERFVRQADAKGAAVDTVFGLQRWTRPYGKIYIAFGEPIWMENYQGSASNGDVPKANISRLEKDVTTALQRLMTLTPVNLLAVAAQARFASNSEAQFSREDAVGAALEIFHRAEQAGVNMASVLTEKSDAKLESVLREAAGKLVWRGALVAVQNGYRITGLQMLNYYANHIRPTLEMLGV